MNRFFAVALTIVCVLSSKACWYATHEPMGYYTCHIPTSEEKPSESMVKLWQRTMLPNVSVSEIEKLIYNDGNPYTLSQIENLQVSAELRPYLLDNDRALLDYVLTMRGINGELDRLSDPWHYYYPGDPVTARLDSLANVSISRLDTKYGDRYAVIAGRALNALKRYDTIDSIAKNHKFHDADMKQRFMPEYAGVLYHLGKFEEALPIYAKEGDLISTKWCLEKLGLYADRMSTIIELSKYPQNYELVASELAYQIRRYEDDAWINWTGNHLTKAALADLIVSAHIRSAIKDKYQPLWRYSEACCHLLDSNNFERADSVLSLINTRNIDPELAKSVRALRFITQSKLKPYDKNYLAWLANEAKYLINLSDEQRQAEDFSTFERFQDGKVTAEQIMFSRRNHCSILYFSDMLHKATDCIIVPKMLEHGDTISALQLLDIIDYANLTDDEVKQIDDHGNTSACFAMECSADVISKAMGRNPLAKLWHQFGSIRNPDRWNDLLGTSLIAEGRYEEAVAALEKVSSQYARYWYTSFKNPFALQFQSDGGYRGKDAQIEKKLDYKLSFAQRMLELEKMKDDESLSPQKRAEAGLRYGVGMANSIFPCWSLTRYGVGGSVFSPWQNPNTGADKLDNETIIHGFLSETYWSFSDFIEYNRFANSEKRLNSLRHRALAIIDKSLTMMTDREKVADYHRQLGNYLTVKHRYADTHVAQELKSRCDGWELW